MSKVLVVGSRLRCARTLLSSAFSAFVASLKHNALTISLTPALLAPLAHAQRTYIFQQGTNGYAGAVDTSIRQGAANTAQGLLDFFEWHTDDPAGTGLDTYALLRFDDIFGPGPNQIPPGSPIISATLTYTPVDGNSVGTLSEITVPWDNATTFNTFGPAPGVQASDMSVESIATAYGTYGFANVTRSLTKWTDNPAANRGWIFRPTNSVTRGRMRSSEFATVHLRPSLNVVVNDTSRPTLLRRPYLQKATTNSIAIRWRTDAATDSRVRYGAAPGALTEVVVTPALVKDHSVTITGLAPGLTYFYEVGSSEHALAGDDAVHYFTTHPPIGASVPLTFWTAGDTGSVNSPMVAARNAMIAANGGVSPDFAVHVGDIAYVLATDGEFTDNFLSPYHTILRNTVCWPAIGNHEHYNANSLAQTGTYYETFTLPTAGEAGGAPSGTEAYYSFTYGDVHFVGLNSDGVPRSPGSPMLTWLANDLAAAKAAGANWLIAFWHHPPYSRGTHNSDLGIWSIDMRQNVVPILEQAGVDLVLTGHSHGYERSYFIDGAYSTPSVATGGVILDSGDGRPAGDGAYTKNAGLNPREGSVHAVVGHGASAHGLSSHPLIRFNEGVIGSCLVTIDGGVLNFRNIRHDGVISDTFTIIKGNPTPPCPADINGDGEVSAPDLAALLGAWGMSGGPADVTMDGVVNASDLAAILGTWGPCPK